MLLSQLGTAAGMLRPVPLSVPSGLAAKGPRLALCLGLGAPCGEAAEAQGIWAGREGLRSGENLSALQSKPISCRAEGKREWEGGGRGRGREKGQGEVLSMGRADLQPLTLGLPGSSPGQASCHWGHDSLDACPPAQGGAPGACLGAAPLAPAPVSDGPRRLQGDQGEVWRRAWHGCGVCASGTRAQGSEACREEPGSSPSRNVQQGGQWRCEAPSALQAREEQL